MHVIRNRDPWRINIIPKEGARWKLRNGDIHEILASAIISWMIAEPTEWRNIRIQVRGGGTQAAHLCPSPFDPRSRMRTGEVEEGGFWEDSKEAKRNARPRNPGRAIPESRNANSTGILNGRYSTVAFPGNAWPCMRRDMGLLCPRVLLLAKRKCGWTVTSSIENRTEIVTARPDTRTTLLYERFYEWRDL